MTCQQTEAHKSSISYVTVFKEQLELILSSSIDGYLKLWSSSLELYCCLNIHDMSPTLWSLPIDWSLKELH